MRDLISFDNSRIIDNMKDILLYLEDEEYEANVEFIHSAFISHDQNKLDCFSVCIYKSDFIYREVSDILDHLVNYMLSKEFYPFSFEVVHSDELDSDKLEYNNKNYMSYKKDLKELVATLCPHISIFILFCNLNYKDKR